MENKFIMSQKNRYKNLSSKTPDIINNTINNNINNYFNENNPIQKVFSEKIALPIILALEPKDLLSLYISDKQFNYFNHKNILSNLNHKYNIKSNSFTEFIKLYNQSLINPNLNYLYELENNIELPSNDYVFNFVNSKYIINNRIRATLFDWMISIKYKYASDQPEFISLAMTYVDAYLYKNTSLSYNQLQCVGCVCMYLAEYMIVDDRENIDFYIKISGKAFTKDKFNEMLNNVFNDLKGILIRPVTSLFIEMNDLTRDLVNFTYLIPNLMKYKPSMIAETISYMVYGNYKIYDLSELNIICKTIYNYLIKIKDSNFDNFKKIGKKAFKNVNYQCGEELKEYIDSPFKYHEPWHLGEFKKLNKLGEGAYGEVVRIQCNTTNQEFVIKTNLQDKAVSLMEIALIKQLKQENVINICQFTLKNDKVKIVMPYMGDSLDKLLKNKTFDKLKIVTYFKQICMGLQECHKNDIIHRDIKPENIIYDSKNDLFKIIDFGISVSYSSKRYYLDPHMASTFYYRAPEALILLKDYNYKVDIWALGVTFYFILTGKHLFTEYDNIEALNDIFKLFGKPTIEEWPEFYKNDAQYYNNWPRNFKLIDAMFGDYKQLLIPCFIYDFNKRPDTKQLLYIADKYY